LVWGNVYVCRSSMGVWRPTTTMVVNAEDEMAQRYQSNTPDQDEFYSSVEDVDLDGDEWTDGLDDVGVENADDLDGDEIWASEWSVSESEAGDYESNTTAEAWADTWGDASEWDV